MINDLIKLARPHQYAKNLFVFLPAFFAFQFNDISVILNAFAAFLSFSLFASSVYVVNDWQDRKEDLLHPEKRDRPIASGRIKSTQAFFFYQSCLWRVLV